MLSLLRSGCYSVLSYPVALGVLLALFLAVLELLHPTWSDGAVSEAVLAAGPEWTALHVLLLLGYVALVVVLWRMARGPFSRGVLIAFALLNTTYLAIDGLGVGLLARTDPAAAERLWNSAWVNVLADLTGATWSAALLLLTLGLRSPIEPIVKLGCGLAWIAFLATAIPDVAGPAVLLSRIAALGTGALCVYQRGSVSIPIALFIFAAVLRQHVGAEAALGLVFVAIATARSGPAAASPLSPD